MHLESKDVSEGIFADAMASLPDIIQAWRDSLRDALLAQLPKTHSNTRSAGSLPPETLFSLATSMFIAYEHTPLYYPNVLHHSNISGKPIRQGYNTTQQSWYIGQSSCPPFNVRYDTHGVRILLHLLKECGLDPETTTPAVVAAGVDRRGRFGAGYQFSREARLLAR